MDGPSEAEAQARQNELVERRTSKIFGRVADKVRELELKSAMPVPRHFQPAGHTRHAKSTSHLSQKSRRDEPPAVQLIFPLHIHRFPRRTSDGSPYRPETPIHRSVPDDEPYIHSPQPSRSMPMLKDPPEPEHVPEPVVTSRGDQDDSAIASGYSRRSSKSFAVRRNSRP